MCSRSAEVEVMPSRARVQYENAFYHVMHRRRGRRWIYHGDEYYESFLLTLAEAHERYEAKFHAYCLMGNHYHLLVDTPLANLDRIMRHINGVHTQMLQGNAVLTERLPHELVHYVQFQSGEMETFHAEPTVRKRHTSLVDYILRRDILKTRCQTEIFGRTCIVGVNQQRTSA